MTELLRRGNNLLTGIKLITYVLVSFLLIVDYSGDGLEILAVLIAVLISNSFFRQEYLYRHYGDSLVSYVSILLEVLLIVGIGILPIRVGYYVYLFFVSVSEATIVFPRINGMVAAFVVLLAMPFTAVVRAGATHIWPLVMEVAPAWIVSIMFVYIMSYIVKIQITEREKLARTNAELEDTYRKLVNQMQRAEALSVEKERVRMSREIHDTLAHTLTAVLVQMEAAKKTIGINPGQAVVDIESAQSVTREGLSELKRTIRALRPEILESHSFEDALKLMVQDQQLLQVDLEITLEDERAEDPNTEVVLLRLLQETITNAVRHGKASQLAVNIEQKQHMLSISMQDNGIGTGMIRKGFGLTGMQERIEKSGGTIQFFSQPGKGFRTQVKIPWSREGTP